MAPDSTRADALSYSQAELIYEMYKNGAQGLSFDPIVVSGPNTSMPHGVAGERVIQEGDFITMDFGVLYQGYCSDTTRTFAVGYATEEMKKVYNVVLQAQLAGIAVTKAGVTGAEVDGAARKVISDAGYGDYFGHSYGHGVGLEIHEGPNMSFRNEKPIPAGAVTSAEPGIYLPEKFGFSEAEFDNLKAQCRVLRAWFYIRLLDAFRNVPLAVSFNDVSQNTETQVEPKVIFDFIESELLETIPMLVEKTSLGSNSTIQGQWTKAAAAALLVRLYLNAQVYIGEEKYNECAAIAQKIVAGEYGKYEIADRWDAAFDRAIVFFVFCGQL